MIRTWLAVAFLAGILVPAGAAGWRLHALNQERAVARFQERQLHSAEQIAAVLRSELTGAARTLRAVAVAVAHDSDPRLLHDVLDQQTRCGSAPCFTSLAVVDATGALGHSTGPVIPLDAAAREALLRWAQRPANASRVQTIIATASTIVLATPAFDESRSAAPPGVVFAQVAFESLVAPHVEAGDANRARDKVIVFDNAGSVIFHSTHPEMRLNNVFRRSARCATCHDSFAHVERMLQIKHGVLRYATHAVPQLGAVAPLDVGGEPWVAAVISPTEQVVGVLSTELRQLGLLLLAVAAAAAGAVRVTWRDGRRRMETEAAAARQVELARSHAALTALNATLESAAVEWRTTVDTMDGAVLVLDSSGRIDRMNRIAAETLPGEPFSWLGEASERLAAIPPWDSALALARAAIDRGAASTSRVQDSATGRTWDLWCRAPQQSGHRAAVVILARDVTAVVELQESLRRSETMAALGSVVVGVAHEVRNPLFAISSLVDAWSMQKQRDPQPFVDALRGAVVRVQTLMNELLEYGRPSTPVLEPHPLAPVIEDAIRACQHEADARRLRLLLTGAADATVAMDPRRLLRVFINVIQNAVQHSPADGEVLVDVACGQALRPGAGGRDAVAFDATRVDVVVRDRGAGFAVEDLPRLFTPFFSRRPGGFGLGLAISERIVAEHRGRIAAANHPGGGGMVTISLRLAAAGGADRIEGARPC